MQLFPEELAEQLTARAGVTGLTLSGGEPMAQALALARTVRAVRRRRPRMDVICFSGFTLQHLRRHPPSAGVDDLLDEIDVLIDGPYVAGRNDGLGMRGSTNQRVHHLTDRLVGCDYDFTGRRRDVEIQIRDQEALLVGVPTPSTLAAFELATNRAVLPRNDDESVRIE